jgi:hypothetical protein
MGSGDRDSWADQEGCAYAGREGKLVLEDTDQSSVAQLNGVAALVADSHESNSFAELLELLGRDVRHASRCFLWEGSASRARAETRCLVQRLIAAPIHIAEEIHQPPELEHPISGRHSQIPM